MNMQGILNAIVINNEDPEKLGRVRVTIPALPGGPELWARGVSPLAGPDRGSCFLPEVDDEVLVAFTQGDLSSAYVLGGLWGVQKTPPESIGQSGNEIKCIRTRSGHLLEFDDSDSSERITLKDKNDNSIIIDTDDNRITITSQKEMEIIADKNITLKADNIKLQAKEIIIEADSSFKLDGGSSADIQAGTINLN